MRNKTKNNSISRGINYYCNQLLKKVTGKKQKDQYELLETMIKAKNCILKKIVETTLKYQIAFYSLHEKELVGNHQITRLSNHLAKPMDEMIEEYQKKVSEEFLASGMKVNEVWGNVEEMSIEEAVEKMLKVAHDESDLAKPHARKMEGISIVRDGSQSSKNNCKKVNGYLMNGSLGIGKRKHYPINLDLYSTGKDPKYARHLYPEKKSLEIQKQNGMLYQVMNLYDRGYDDVKWFRYLTNQSAQFIIRGKEKRHLAYVKDLKTIKLAKTAKEKDQYFKPITKIEEEIEFLEYPEFPKYKVGYAKILVKYKGYKCSKNKYYDRYVELSLVIIKLPKSKKLDEDMKSGRNEGKIYLYTSLKVETAHQAMVIFRLYLKRWKIEVYFRFIKQSYELEKIRLKKYEKIKNIVNYAMIASYYDYQKFEEFWQYERTKKEKAVEKLNMELSNIIKGKLQKQRKTYLEMEIETIDQEYRLFMRFKGLYSNVSSYAGFVREYYKPTIKYKEIGELKTGKEKGILIVNYELFLRFKGIKKATPSAYAAFIKDYYHPEVGFVLIRCRGP